MVRGRGARVGCVAPGRERLDEGVAVSDLLVQRGELGEQRRLERLDLAGARAAPAARARDRPRDRARAPPRAARSRGAGADWPSPAPRPRSRTGRALRASPPSPRAGARARAAPRSPPRSPRARPRSSGSRASSTRAGASGCRRARAAAHRGRRDRGRARTRARARARRRRRASGRAARRCGAGRAALPRSTARLRAPCDRPRVRRTCAGALLAQQRQLEPLRGASAHALEALRQSALELDRVGAPRAAARRQASSSRSRVSRPSSVDVARVEQRAQVRERGVGTRELLVVGERELAAQLAAPVVEDRRRIERGELRLGVARPARSSGRAGAPRPRARRRISVAAGLPRGGRASARPPSGARAACGFASSPA